MKDHFLLRIGGQPFLGSDMLTFFILREPHRHGTDVRIFLDGEGSDVEVRQGMAPPHFGYLARDDAQQLANDLWEAGVRPSQARMGQGMADAQSAHLADLRAIVAKKLGVELPQT